MRLHYLALAAALSLSVPVALSAQTTSSTQTTTTTTTTNTSINPSYPDHPNRWIATAFVGSNFSNNSGSMFGGVNSPTAVSTSTGTTGTVSSSGSSVDYGAQVGYLWHGMAGAEFLAGFTPNFHLDNTLIASGTTPNVNTYMVNAMGAVPIGTGGTVQPFISGGFGAITMRGLSASTSSAGTTVTTTGTSDVSSDLFSPNESHAGGDIGGGIMAFMGGWGVRGDIRYFRAFGNTTSSSSTSTTGTTTTGTTAGATTTTTSSSTLNLLPGLNFWRANIGLAFRW